MGISLCIRKDYDNNDFQFTQTKQYLELYTKEVENAEVLFDTKSKDLNRIVLEQPGWLQYYGILYAELKAGCDVVQSLLDERKAIVWQNLTEKHSRDLNHNDKNNYVYLDQTFISLRKIFLAINEVKDVMEVLVESFKAQGYAMNGYMRMKTAGVDNVD